MTRPAAFALLLLALSGCDEPAPYFEAAPPPDYLRPRPVAQVLDVADQSLTERPGPISWNAEDQTFVHGGQPLRAARLWTFDGSTEGFTGTGAAVLPADPAGLHVVNAAADPVLRSPAGLELDGARHPVVLVRLSRLKAGGAWSGAVFYVTNAHGEGEAWRGLPLDRRDLAVGETATLVYDMRSPPPTHRGDWTGAIVQAIRLDLDDMAGGEFLIHQVAIVEAPGGPLAGR